MLLAVWFVNRQRQVRVDFPEEKPGAGVLIDKHRIFSDPAKPGLLCNSALQHWRAIDKGAVGPTSRGFLNARGELSKSFADQFVVVAPESIP